MILLHILATCFREFQGMFDPFLAFVEFGPCKCMYWKKQCLYNASRMCAEVCFHIGNHHDLWVHAFKASDKIYFMQTVLNSCTHESGEMSVSIEHLAFWFLNLTAVKILCIYNAVKNRGARSNVIRVIYACKHCIISNEN